MWVEAAWTFSHANQETNASLEAFYITLKGRFLKGKQNMHGRPTDWLFHILTTEAVPFFSYEHHPKESNRINPAANSISVENAFTLALRIPDLDVRYPQNVHVSGLGHVALVRSQSRKEIWYEVFNAQPEWALCTCVWALKGNICKHQLKVMLMERATISSTVSNCIGLVDEHFDVQESLNLEPPILEQEAYQETHMSSLLLRENTIHPPCKGLEEDIERLQQQTLQLAGKCEKFISMQLFTASSFGIIMF
jgi:hypothetical protein